MLLMTVSIAMMVTLVSSAVSVGPFLIQSAWALPYVSSVSVSPSSTEKTKGETATYTVTVSRASGQGSGDVNLSFESSSIPSSAATLSSTKVNFGNGGSNSKSVSLTINTNDLSIQEHSFTVKGTKSNAASDSATSSSTQLTVIEPPNQEPTANAGSDQTVNEGDTVSLDGSGSSDPDGTIESYSWTQTTGTSVTLSDASSATPSFTAPDVGADGETLTLELTVTDNDGATSTADTVNVDVNNVIVNQEPTANAGSDQTVNEGDTVSLDGSGSSDPDGDTLTYAWTQTTGTSVTLSDASSATPSFTAPDIDSAGDTLTFELTVDDGNGHTATDAVAINVNNVIVNQPPVASLTANPTTIEEGSTSALDASASTDDVGIVEYVFEQVGGTAGTITVDSTDPSKATFQAPSISTDETATIKVTVKDAEDATDSVTVEIAVKNVVHVTTLTLNTITNAPWGNPITVTGKLTDNAASGAGVGGATISFDGTGADNLPDVVTNADGTFTASGKSPTTVATGWKVQAHFVGNTDYSGSDSIVQSYATTKHSVGSSITATKASVAWGQPNTFTVTLKDTATGLPLQGVTVTFDGTGAISIPNAVTGSDGKATGTGNSPNSVATGWTYQAHFAGNSLYNKKDTEIKTYATVKHSVGVAVTVAKFSVAWGQPNTFTATVTDTATGLPLQGVTVTFDGTGAISIPNAVTGSDGKATGTGNSPNSVATGWTYQAHFAGDNLYNKKDSTLKTYSTLKHSVSLTLNLFPTTVGSGAVYKVSGVLKDTSAGGVAIGSKTISLTADSPITIADQTTDATGTYITKPTAPTTAGTYNIQSHFASDDLYNAKDSPIKTLTVS
jgi:5-hydroxyisourate hydrolase-like protein (transthyretin family)